MRRRYRYRQMRLACRKHKKTLRPREGHPNKIQLSRDMLELENPDSSEVERTVGHIFLDFSKVRLKDVHSLQKETFTEIRVRGNTLEK